MSQSKTVTSAKEYGISGNNLRVVTGRVWRAVGIGHKRKMGFILLGLALTVFLLIALFPALSGSDLPPAFRLVLWLVFGIASVWGGYLLGDILHPEQLLLQEITKSVQPGGSQYFRCRRPTQPGNHYSAHRPAPGKSHPLALR